MKKVLFATTALVATAGVASADVSISGYAEMGVNGGSAAAQETEFHQDIEVTFSMSGTTDSGLTFGTAIQLDEAGTTGAGTDTADDDGVAVYVGGSFGTVTMGDTDGAMDWAITETVGNPGSLGDDQTASVGGYFGGGIDAQYDNQVLRFDTTVNGVGFAVSAEQDDTGALDDGMAIGIKATVGTVNVAVAMQNATNATEELDATAFSANTTLGDFVAGVAYMDVDSSVAGRDYDQTQFSFGTTMGLSSFGVIISDRSGFSAAEGVGAAYKYDLGGGAAFHAGYGDTDGGESTWSAGLAMS